MHHWLFIEAVCGHDAKFLVHITASLWHAMCSSDAKTATSSSHYTRYSCSCPHRYFPFTFFITSQGSFTITNNESYVSEGSSIRKCAPTHTNTLVSVTLHVSCTVCLDPLATCMPLYRGPGVSSQTVGSISGLYCMYC